ncbi:DUF1877 family protein [Streptomyces phaeofaciens]|uniref:DUF1877 family protein n=1 Tax=Streptomyces phaeofaciens TaxID=68254 RepID=UPI003679BB7B
MSMWLNLAKTDPARLREARENPELIDALFSDEDDPEQAADLHEEDYRTLAEIAEGRAAAEEDSADWTSAYPWLARATGHGCETVEEYDFGYGPAFLLTPDEVRQVADGLEREGWTRFLELGPYYAEAATEGKGMIGGIS